MKEYSIYFIVGGGVPYNLNTFKDINDCKIKVNNLINEYKEKNKLYYLDNDFYENEFKLDLVLNNKNGKYLKIIERDVTTWHEYKESQHCANDKNISLYLR